jgi:cation transport regulator ChaB
MPYSSLDELPDGIQKLPKHAQEIYRAAFNAAYEEWGEERAHAIAWTAVKQKYRQEGDGWVAKSGIEKDELQKIHDVLATEMRRRGKYHRTPMGKAGDLSFAQETALIREHQKEPAAQKPHAFKAAEWTHPNGHPRCIICGNEEPEGGQCPGLAKEPIGKRAGFVPIRLLKAAPERRLVYGVVLEPGDPEHVDTQGDFIPADEIEKSCHAYMRQYRVGKATLGWQHEREAEADIVECYIAPVGFQMGKGTVKAGSWMLVCRVADDDIWEQVKKGELTGYSIGGIGERTPAEEATT